MITKMMKFIRFLLPLAIAGPTTKGQVPGPTVQLSYAIVVGSSAGGVDSFKGIPLSESLHNIGGWKHGDG